MRSSRRWLPSRPTVAVLAAVLATAAIALSGCGGGAGSAKPAVSDAWVRLPIGADTSSSAAYLTITNTSGAPDALLSVVSPIGELTLHQTAASTDMSGMTGMSQVDRIEIPAGGTVRLEPGGYHAMIMGIKEPLTVGQKVTLTLTFEHAGTITVDAEVRAG
jgi:copper(I)-binding protein